MQFYYICYEFVTNAIIAKNPYFVKSAHFLPGNMRVFALFAILKKAVSHRKNHSKNLHSKRGAAPEIFRRQPPLLYCIFTTETGLF